MFEWVKSTGMDTSDISVEVAPVEDLARGELGLIAKSAIEPGDVLAWAPTSLLLNKAKAVAVWGELVAHLPDRIALCLLLLHERFIRADRSPWSTYMASLPKFDGDVSGPSFLWSEEELEWLEGSDCYPASVQMYNTVLEEFDHLNATLFAKRPDDFPAEVFNVDNLIWAAAVVASRAYGDDVEGAYLSIAPLVDFLNHQAGALQLTRFSNGIVAYAGRRYEPGDQVWVSYGGKSNAQLLSQYGFVDDGNDEEAVYLRMGPHLRVAEPYAAAKLRLLAELLGEGRDPSTAIFKLTRRPRDWEAQLLPAARLLALSEEEFVPVTVWELVPTQAPRLEAGAWALLEEACDRRAAEYPATLVEDRRALAAGGLSERNLLAIRLRISEQELIQLVRVYASERKEAAMAELAELA